MKRSPPCGAARPRSVADVLELHVTGPPAQLARQRRLLQHDPARPGARRRSGIPAQGALLARVLHGDVWAFFRANGSSFRVLMPRNSLHEFARRGEPSASPGRAHSERVTVRSCQGPYGSAPDSHSIEIPSQGPVALGRVVEFGRGSRRLRAQDHARERRRSLLHRDSADDPTLLAELIARVSIGAASNRMAQGSAYWIVSLRVCSGSGAS